MERPIDFSKCSLPRHKLKIPCEIEVGKNYRDFKKFKDIPIIGEEPELLNMPPKTITESFLASVIPQDTKMDDLLYKHDRTIRKFEVGE